jgi:nitrate/nitrite transport system permease protein
LAWLPLGPALFQKPEPPASSPSRLLHVADSAQHGPLDPRNPRAYPHVAKVLQLSPTKTFFKVLLPAALPYMFTGFRLSLGIAWLVIVAVEMLTGTPGIGGFLWQEYNSLIYEHIILCILTIGFVGFLLDRLMGFVERRFKLA